jgi:DNA-binding CsgD family transcriptional regulator
VRWPPPTVPARNPSPPANAPAAGWRRAQRRSINALGKKGVHLSTDTGSIVNLIGRAREIAALEELLGASPPAPAAVLAGVAGIGKTSLLEAGAELGRARGFRVLSARPGEAEVKLSFAALADLLDGVGDEVLAGLPAPQRRALEVALARAEPTGAPPEPLAIAAGFLNALRLLAAGERLLIAIDDAQWLDASSAAALVFTARRVAGERVRLLLVLRTGSESEVEQALASELVTRIPVPALDSAVTRKLLSARCGLNLPSRQLRQVFESSQGNPLIILELGRVLNEQGHLEPAPELPVEVLAGDLSRERVLRLRPAGRRALLAVAISPQMTEPELAALSVAAGLDEAVNEGVLMLDRGRLRASHPLLAAAAVQQSTSAQRRELHYELAGALGDELRAAHHLAMATVGHDPQRAGRLAYAADLAMRRGATNDAVELAGHALALTPPGDEQISARLLALAECLLAAFELDRLAALLAPRIAELPAGPLRARAHLLLAESTADLIEHGYHLERALEQSQHEPALRAIALAMKSELFTVIRVEHLEQAERWTEEGLRLAAPGTRAGRRLRVARAWVRILRGLPARDDAARDEAAGAKAAGRQAAGAKAAGGEAAGDEPAAAGAIGGCPPLDGISVYEGSIERPAAVRLAFRGEIAAAAASLQALWALAEERGEAVSRTVLHIQLWELALRAGDVREARRLLEVWEERDVEDLAPARWRGETLLAAMTGDIEATAANAATALELCRCQGWNRLETLRALGLAALLGNDPLSAVERFGEVWEQMRRERVDDPGVFPVAGDLVEALAELGRTAEAREVSASLAALAEAQRHPWGLATSARSEAILQLADGYRPQAVAMIEQAARAYAELGLRFDQARTLLALGRLLRRHRKWGAAREALGRAAGSFEELGCEGWAERARLELARVGARRPQAEGRLTAAQSRVARLAAKGLSNKEIARELVITVHTVEVHLSHAYTKLGVRSRSQLATALAAQAAATAAPLAPDA